MLLPSWFLINPEVLWNTYTWNEMCILSYLFIHGVYDSTRHHNPDMGNYIRRRANNFILFPFPCGKDYSSICWTEDFGLGANHSRPCRGRTVCTDFPTGHMAQQLFYFLSWNWDTAVRGDGWKALMLCLKIVNIHMDKSLLNLLFIIITSQ